MMNLTPTVKQLLIINIMMAVAGLVITAPAGLDSPLMNLFALHFPLDSNFGIWQLFTHMFMHGGLMHIVFNMFALVSFGSMLEHYWGAKKFLFFYISCGLGAALLQLGINYLEFKQAVDAGLASGLTQDVIDKAVAFPITGNWEIVNYVQELIDQGVFSSQQQVNNLGRILGQTNSTMVGASGAIYGLLVAFAFMFPNAELAMLFIPVPIRAKYFVPGIIVIDLVMGLNGSSLFGDNSGGGGIAHFAHIGGAIVGFIMMWMWKRNSFNDRRWN
jgi:membrane associated rhomboid family serine protease